MDARQIWNKRRILRTGNVAHKNRKLRLPVLTLREYIPLNHFQRIFHIIGIETTFFEIFIFIDEAKNLHGKFVSFTQDIAFKLFFKILCILLLMIPRTSRKWYNDRVNPKKIQFPQRCCSGT